MSNTYIPAQIRKDVWERAKGCCEYCLLHSEDAFFTHEVDHIISEKHRGTTTLDNLCLSCFECNRYKGSDIGSLDIETDTFTQLYNPRIDKWETHFRLENVTVIPITAVGRVTEFLLQLNTEDRRERREVLFTYKRYPCTDD